MTGNAVTQWFVTFLVAALGWWAGHYFSSRRDLTNERRKLRITYLLEAYRRLESASNRDNPSEVWPKMESAIADIQLLGSSYQVSLARQFSLSMAQDGTAPLDQLIFDLRQSLRAELQLEQINDSVVYLRYYEKSKSHGAN
ncbi:MAG: hypothetical protein ACRECC_05335 [Pseudolabrys sp.]|jgi:hypothetical protein